MYQQGKIYKITSNLTDKIYIGSTCNPLYKRLGQHKQSFNIYVNGGNIGFTTSFEIIKLGDAIITLIEDFPCERKELLTARERYYIELNKDIVVNKHIPNREWKDYYRDNREHRIFNSKNYVENNKEKVAEYQQKYRELNKDKIIEYNKNKREDKKALQPENPIKEKKSKQLIAKESYERNKDKIKEKANEVIKCECGIEITKGCKSKHMKTKKHIELLKSTTAE
jgi:hypothetical protein